MRSLISARQRNILCIACSVGLMTVLYSLNREIIHNRINMARTWYTDVENSAQMINGREDSHLEHKVKTSLRAVRWPWFFVEGTRRPVPGSRKDPSGRLLLPIWPHEAPLSDRIFNQLMYIPPLATTLTTERVKKIVIYNSDLENWKWMKAGRDVFQECPVDKCTISLKSEDVIAADLTVFAHSLPCNASTIRERVPRHQVWMLVLAGTPVTEPQFASDLVNWTMSCRIDSDLVDPHARWMYYEDKDVRQDRPRKNYAANKTKKVAWFVFNCNTSNDRLDYAVALSKHIEVDVFGECGNLRCNDTDWCLRHLEEDYKFYLSFEESNCKHYITREFYKVALQHNVIPIVMGARLEDYVSTAPFHSFIHVDDFDSPAKLAEYLLRLDKDDTLYNSYFLWKGTGQFIDDYLPCRLCAMLHDDYPTKWYTNIRHWWHEPGSCVAGRWRHAQYIGL